ncbi:hypothetical protein ACFL36_06275, partial [Thermodesulfobacteriota bacterium]
MDVCEFQIIEDKINRHPWETARFFFVNNIIKGLISKRDSKFSILDVGCGDCFVASNLMENHP